MKKILSYLPLFFLLSCSIKEKQPYTIHYEVIHQSLAACEIEIMYQAPHELEICYTTDSHWVKEVTLPPDTEAILWVRSRTESDAYLDEYLYMEQLDDYQPWIIARIWHEDKYKSSENANFVMLWYNPKNKDQLTDDWAGLKKIRESVPHRTSAPKEEQTDR